MSDNRFTYVSQFKICADNYSNKTVITDEFCTPPFKIIKPFYDENGNANLVLLSSSDGLMSDDEQYIEVTVKENANLTVTSQSYEKIHKMNDGFAKRKTVIKVENNAYLNWFQ